MHDLPLTSSAADRDVHSSIYEKITADERRKIDRAIVNREPPTYRGVFEKYRLAEKGVSFTAFYNYARRIRGAATNHNLAELVTPAQADLNRAIPRLLADRLIDTLLYAEDATPAQIHRLTVAYASAINSSIKAHDACHVFPRRPGSSSETSNPLISNPEISDSPTAPNSVPSVPSVPLVPSSPPSASEISNSQISNPPPHAPNTVDSPIPHSAFRLPHSSLPAIPDPLAPRIDLADLPDRRSTEVDPDPRREALRQRILAGFNPLNHLDSS